MSKPEIQIERALENFYHELDNIAQPEAVSTDWLPFVAGQIGEGGVMEGYEEWVQETWEPRPEGEVAS